MDLRVIGVRAKEAASYLNSLGITEKNEGLRQAAQALLDGEEDILTANQEDVIRASENGMSQGLIDRLELTPDRLQAMADGLLQIASLPDPVGEVASMKPRPNGLLIGEKRVPLGVVGMIYEARPNVTSDAFGLCFKTGNAVILKGGSDAIESNKEIVKWLRTGLSRAGLPEDSLQLITDKGMPFGYVEAYKALRTNLDFMAGSMDVHTLVITSTVPEESKSNVAVNLALTLAESGKKVALVDCDLRKPVLHRYLKAGHNVKGVSNVLSNQCTLDEALQELKEMNLTFLPAGTPPPNPSEMLSQPQMQAMVNTLREKFDVVIFDAPPVSVVTDAAVIGRCVDGAMFVVRSDYAPADAVRGAVKKLQDAGVRVLGSVLTRYDMKKALKGSSYAYSYAYNYNYAYEKQKADVVE